MQKGWENAKKVIQNGEADVVVLDEINIALDLNMIDEKDVIETIKNIMEKRKELHEGSSLQYELVTNILDEIMKQDKEEEKSI